MTDRARDASPVDALKQAETVLAQRLTFLAEQVAKGDTPPALWLEYAAVAAALANVMGQTRGWGTRKPDRPPWGPRP